MMSRGGDHELSAALIRVAAPVGASFLVSRNCNSCACQDLLRQWRRHRARSDHRPYPDALLDAKPLFVPSNLWGANVKMWPDKFISGFVCLFVHAFMLAVLAAPLAQAADMAWTSSVQIDSFTPGYKK